MEVQKTTEYEIFKQKINQFSRNEGVPNVSNETVETILKLAKNVPVKFDQDITIQKGKDGTKPGAVTALIAILLFSIIKNQFGEYIDFEPDIKISIILAIAAILGGIYNGAQQLALNWIKHRKNI